MSRFILLLSLAAATGCVNLKPQPDPARFFVLAGAVATPAPRVPGSLLGVGPITWPGYLERSQVVTRVGPGEVRLSEVDRWAEYFPEMATRLLADDLGSALGAERVVVYPWQRTLSPAPVIEVRFAQLERDATGAAQLEAEWRVRGRNGERSGHSRITEPASGNDTAAAADALSRALGRFAQELATEALAVGAGTP
jgi:hypothetical protein